MSLFVYNDEPLKLHSGETSFWKVCCEHLTEEDLHAAMAVVYERLPSPSYGHVLGVERGGLRWAEHFRGRITWGCKTVLIVDDVCTTGKSLEEWKGLLAPSTPVAGAVLFARGPWPSWVVPWWVDYGVVRERFEVIRP